MPLISVSRNSVQQSAIPRYERIVRFIAERARQDKDTFKWNARITTGAAGRTIGFVSRVEGFAELSTREEPDAMIRRLFGEADGTALLESLGEGVTSSSYTVSTIRDDLSNAPPQPAESALKELTAAQVARLEGLPRSKCPRIPPYERKRLNRSWWKRG